MKYTFKSLDNLHLYMLLFIYLCLLPINVMCLTVFITSSEKLSLVFFGIGIFVPFLIFLFCRIISPYKYIIDDQYLIKYKGNKILLKVKKVSINEIIVKKTTVFKSLKFIGSLVAVKLSCSNITSFSLVFNDYDVLTNYNYGEFERLPLLGENKDGFVEYVDIMSYKQIKKISHLLNTKIRFIK